MVKFSCDMTLRTSPFLILLKIFRVKQVTKKESIIWQVIKENMIFAPCGAIQLMKLSLEPKDMSRKLDSGVGLFWF